MALDKLPQVTDAKDIKTIRDAFDKIEAQALTVEYGTAAPTQLNYGRLFVVNDGTTQAVYIKTMSAGTADGLIIAI